MKGITKIYIAGIIAFVLSLIFDKSIMLFSLNLRFGFLDFVMKIITPWWIIVLFILIMGVVLLKKKKSLVLLIGALSAFIIGNLLKWIIARPRPDLSQLVDASFYSMPSSHAIVLFAMVPILHKKYPKYLWLWLLIAIVISLSRLYLGVHYLSDLIIGAMIGYLIGLGVLLLNDKYKFGVF